MASHRNAASSTSDPEGRASADAPPAGQSQAAKEKPGSDSTPPRAGRTGNLGARAERPAENRAHKTCNGEVDPVRRDKAPSPAAKDGQHREDDLPLPMRDSTG